MAGISSSAVSSGPISSSEVMPPIAAQLNVAEAADVAVFAAQSVTSASLSANEDEDTASASVLVTHALALAATETPDAAIGSVVVLAFGGLALSVQESPDTALLALTLSEDQADSAREAQKRRLRLAIAARRRDEEAEPLRLYTTMSLAAREGSDRVSAYASLSWPPPDGEEELMVREYFEAMGFELID